MSSIHGGETVIPAQPHDDIGAREETSLFGFLNILLKYRAMIASLMLVFGIAGLVKFFEAVPKYTTRVGINVIQNQPRQDAGGLAAQLGVVGGSSDEVAFFIELLRSPPVLRQAAKGPYTAATGKGSVTGPLARFYGHERPPEQFQDEMTEILTNNIRIAGSARTGNLWIFVDAPYPDLSQQIADNLVSQLDVFSRRRRHSQAAAEREFVQGRLAEANDDLRAAEQRIVQFRLANRDYSSPTLDMTNAELQRDVTMRQQLYTSLLQSYDNARMAEARNLPTITLLESPERPRKAERSSAASMPLLGAITGLLIAIVLAFARERMAETAAAPTAAFDDYRELKRQTLRDLKNPFRPLGRALNRSSRE